MSKIGPAVDDSSVGLIHEREGLDGTKTRPSQQHTQKLRDEGFTMAALSFNGTANTTLQSTFHDDEYSCSTSASTVRMSNVRKRTLEEVSRGQKVLPNSGFFPWLLP